MDPFTQRMLERARARQEKIDQKLASSGQIPKRKPLTENVSILKSETSTVKSPSKILKESVVSPRKSSKETFKISPPVKSPRRRSVQKSDQVMVSSPQRLRNDVVVTTKEIKTNKPSSVDKRGSDVSVEINITHRDDIQIEVQVEERDAPIHVVYDTNADSGSNVTIKEIDEDASKMPLEKDTADITEHKSERSGLRHNMKSRLDRLGNLYSDKPNLSSPIHRTELDFNSATPPSATEVRKEPAPKDCKKKFGRLAALADQINNWEDDLTHHSYQPEATKKQPAKSEMKNNKLDSSMLDVSIHSLKDINKVLQSTTTESKISKSSNSDIYTKPSANKFQRLDKKIVAELEENENDATDNCIQTKPEPADDKPVSEKGSPVVKKLAPKLNGNVDRSSVLTKAAMFESGSPRTKEKDPAEMSLRERKALFERNKGAAIIPKAPFALAPSAKTLHGDNKVDAKPVRPVVQPANVKTTPTKSNTSRTNSKENLPDDNVSQSSLGGGIKGKLAALFSKEQTISESTIANKFKQEREKEMEMLQNRFNYKPKQPIEEHQNNDSDDDQSDHDPSEKAPLMGSTTNIVQNNKKPEIIANVPKVTFEDRTRSETALNTDKEAEHNEPDRVVGSQPVKRRSSQDSPVVLSVLEDVKRIKVNNNKEPQTNGAVTQQPTSIYPHLSDIETDTSHNQEEYSDCGGSRCGHYALECVFFFLCI